MNTTTKYLGLTLKNPIIVGSSTLTSNVESIVKCAKAGAGAVVLKSLFEEQIALEIKQENANSQTYLDYPEAQEYLQTYYRGNEIEMYTKLIAAAKEAVDIPIIASINCTDDKEWTSIAKEFEKAGADAIELNISVPAFNTEVTSEEIENLYITTLTKVKKEVKIPIAVKIGDHFTNIMWIVKSLFTYGADGIVLFNRYYNPDIDINNLKVIAGSSMSHREENAKAMRWIGLLRNNDVKADLCANTGIHEGNDVVKMILAGATAVQICSTLYANGIDHITKVISDLEAWMQQHHFESLEQYRGSILNKEENALVLERLQYLRRNAE